MLFRKERQIWEDKDIPYFHHPFIGSILLKETGPLRTSESQTSIMNQNSFLDICPPGCTLITLLVGRKNIDTYTPWNMNGWFTQKNHSIEIRNIFEKTIRPSGSMCSSSSREEIYILLILTIATWETPHSQATERYQHEASNTNIKHRLVRDSMSSNQPLVKQS